VADEDERGEHDQESAHGEDRGVAEFRRQRKSSAWIRILTAND